jgi:hypothetical protein
MNRIRTLLFILFAWGLIAEGPAVGVAKAQNRSGSSGRSYSSGSISSNSRSSSSGKNYSPASRPSSTTSRAPSPPSTFSKPTGGGNFSSNKPPASSGKSYSSGASSSSSVDTKPTNTHGGGSYDAGAAAAQRRQESRAVYSGAKTYPSGGGRSTSVGSQPGVAPRGSYDAPAALAQPRQESRTPSSSGKSYSSGTDSPNPSPPGMAPAPSASGKSYASNRPSPNGHLDGHPGGSSTVATNRKPSGGSYDAVAATAQRHEESRAAFRKGQEPQTAYTDPRGTVRTIDPRDQRVEQLRRELDDQRWANRELRRQQWYGSYLPRPVVVYSDPYSSLFWWWMLDRSLEQQALWAYHHRDLMDAARYRELLAKNARLESRIKELEAQGVARNSAYAPPGLDPDLMYTDEYVTAAYNPQPQAATPTREPPTVSSVHEVSGASRAVGVESHPGRGWSVFMRCLIVAGIAVLLIWLAFIKRWGGSSG